MSRPSKFGSNQRNNRFQSCGPMLEGTVSVATNHMFSGSGALRHHRPGTNPNFSQKNQYCLMGKPKKTRLQDGDVVTSLLLVKLY